MAQFSRIKTWVTGEVLYAADLNNEFNNLLAGFTPAQIDGASASVLAMQTTASTGGVGTENLATNALGELQRLRFGILQAVGGAQWYSAPTRNLETLNTAFNTAIAPINNSLVKTDGTDPGLYGMTTLPFSLQSPGYIATGSAQSTTYTLATVNITKSTKPLRIACYKTNRVAATDNYQQAGGIYIGANFFNKGPATVTTTVTVELLKAGATFAKKYFTLRSILPISTSFTGTNPILIATGTGSGGLVSVSSGTVTGTGNATFNMNTIGSITLNSQQTSLRVFYIPYEALEFIDISAAGSNIAYQLKLTVANPAVTDGSLGYDVEYDGTMYAKEWL